MHTHNSNTPRHQKFWEGLLRWMKALDEAIDRDPHEPIVRKIQQLEARFDRLEKLQLNHQNQSHTTQTPEMINVH